MEIAQVPASFVVRIADGGESEWPSPCPQPAPLRREQDTPPARHDREKAVVTTTKAGTQRRVFVGPRPATSGVEFVLSPKVVGSSA